jgi:ribosomal protein L22
MVVLPGAMPVDVQAVTTPQTVRKSSEAETPKEAVQLGEAEEELAAACAEFKAVWDVYKTNAEKINAEFQPKFEALQQQYQKALETLKANAKNRGDLDKTKVVVAEIARFEETKCPPPTPDKDAIKEIRDLQANAARPFAQLENEKRLRMSTLTKRYGQALDSLQGELVKAEKLDDATVVKEARQRAARAVE